jgi:hypothetical protein
MPEYTNGPEEDVYVVGQDTKAEEPFSFDEDQANLVTEFKKHPEGRAALKRLSCLALQNFKDSWDACENMRKTQADIWKYFSGNLDDKGPQFRGLSNAHVPLLMENTVRMVFRQCYELFGNWTNVFGVTPIGPDDEHIAKLLTLHGNWQIRKRIKDFKRQIGHRGLLVFDLFGDVTCHSYWDPTHKSNRHEILTANEFVCANTHVSTMPDYSDVSWVAKLIYMDGHELRKMDGAWEDVASALKRMPPEWDDSEISQELRAEVDKSVGVDSSVFQKGQYRIIQYEGWLNLPGQERDRYCQVIIDHSTNCVLSLGIHERIDPYDKRRFEFQMKQLEQYTTGMNEVQMFMQEQQQTKMSALSLVDGLDPAGEGPAQAVAMARAVEEMPPPPKPPMPDWMKGDPEAQPEPAATRPIRMFAHGVNIEPIQGIIGLGTGVIHLAQNKNANAALQLFFDQAALGNMKNYITAGDVRFPGGGTLEVGLGKIHKVEGSVDLPKEVMPLDFGPANPQLLQLVENFIKYGNTVSNTPEVLSGESGKSGETAQGLSARIEQATKMLSVPTGKYADFLSQVLENNAALNAVFLDEAEFFSVNNHDPSLGQMGMQSFTVGRDMYDRPYDVEISADLKFTSTQQRISEADALVQLPNSVPALQGNFALLYEVIKKSLEARNRYDLTAMLGAPPPPPEMFGAPTSPPAPPPGMAPPGAPPGGAPPGQGAPPPQQEGPQ